MPTKIFDADGAEIAEVELSDKLARVLEAGEDITVIYHTPQMLRHVLGEQTGSFVLHPTGSLVVVKNVDDLRRYAGLQRAIKAAQEQA